jgi:hypothetical protein
LLNDAVVGVVAVFVPVVKLVLNVAKLAPDVSFSALVTSIVYPRLAASAARGVMTMMSPPPEVLRMLLTRLAGLAVS